jgi:hypothetical protein
MAILKDLLQTIKEAIQKKSRRDEREELFQAHEMIRQGIMDVDEVKTKFKTIPVSRFGTPRQIEPILGLKNVSVEKRGIFET